MWIDIWRFGGKGGAAEIPEDGRQALLNGGSAVGLNHRGPNRKVPPLVLLLSSSGMSLTEVLGPRVSDLNLDSRPATATIRAESAKEGVWRGWCS